MYGYLRPRVIGTRVPRTYYNRQAKTPENALAGSRLINTITKYLRIV